MPKLIATDIDGTMLRANGTLSPRVRQALHSATEAGIFVVPATGRPEMVAANVINALGLGGFWVFANGAMTRNVDTGETVRGYWLDQDVAKNLVLGVRAGFPGAGFAVEWDDGMAYEPGFEHLVPVPPSISPIGDVLEALVGRVQKILVFDPRLHIDQLFQAVSLAVGDSGVASYSGLNFVEVAGKLVTKALALDGLCGDLGLKSSEVAAFGDNHNDIAMLAWAGRGYAMGNATADAKEAADEIILSSDEDGLADAIEGFLARL